MREVSLFVLLRLVLFVQLSFVELDFQAKTSLVVHAEQI